MTPSERAAFEAGARAMREKAANRACSYCAEGWPLLRSISPHHDKERHAYPPDYKGMRAGMGPNCLATAIRALPLPAPPASEAADTRTIGPSSNDTNWREELKSRYASMKDAPWFKEVHDGKSLGDAMPIEGASEAAEPKEKE